MTVLVASSRPTELTGENPQRRAKGIAPNSVEAVGYKVWEGVEAYTTLGAKTGGIKHL